MVHKTLYIKVFTIDFNTSPTKKKLVKGLRQVTKMQKLPDKGAFLAKTVEDTDYKSVKDRPCK